MHIIITGSSAKRYTLKGTRCVVFERHKLEMLGGLEREQRKCLAPSFWETIRLLLSVEGIEQKSPVAATRRSYL